MPTITTFRPGTIIRLSAEYRRRPDIFDKRFWFQASIETAFPDDSPFLEEQAKPEASQETYLRGGLIDVIA